MIIDYGDSENAMLYALQDLVERGYELGIKLMTGEEFDFDPTGLDDDEGVLVGYRLDADGNRAEHEIEIVLDEVEAISC